MGTISLEFWLLAAFTVLALGLSLPALKNAPAAPERPRKARKKREEKQPAPFSNVVLLVLGLFLLAFIVCMVVTFWRFQAVPDTLIQYTMGAGGVEAVVLAGIKISKILKGEKTDE